MAAGLIFGGQGCEVSLFYKENLEALLGEAIACRGAAQAGADNNLIPSSMIGVVNIK